MLRSRVLTFGVAGAHLGEQFVRGRHQLAGDGIDQPFDTGEVVPTWSHQVVYPLSMFSGWAEPPQSTVCSHRVEEKTMRPSGRSAKTAMVRSSPPPGARRTM